MLHIHVASKQDMDDINDAHAYEMQCNYGAKHLRCYSPPPYKNLVLRFGKRTIFHRIPYNHPANSSPVPM
jgi:hypothetical protein